MSNNSQTPSEGIRPEEGFDEPQAKLSDTELKELYVRGTEDDYVHQLQATANAARTAADSYARKAQRFGQIAERLDTATKEEAVKIRQAREQRQHKESGHDLASERRW